MTKTKKQNVAEKEIAERRKIIDEIIERAPFELAYQLAVFGETSKKIIEKRFEKELELEIKEMRSNKTPKHYGRLKNVIKITQLLDSYNLHPYLLIDDALHCLLRHKFSEDYQKEIFDIAKYASQKTKNSVVKIFLKKGLCLDKIVLLQKKEKLNLSELEELLKTTEDHVLRRYI